MRSHNAEHTGNMCHKPGITSGELTDPKHEKITRDGLLVSELSVESDRKIVTTSCNDIKCRQSFLPVLVQRDDGAGARLTPSHLNIL